MLQGHACGRVVRFGGWAVGVRAILLTEGYDQSQLDNFDISYP